MATDEGEDPASWRTHSWTVFIGDAFALSEVEIVEGTEASIVLGAKKARGQCLDPNILAYRYHIFRLNILLNDQYSPIIQ